MKKLLEYQFCGLRQELRKKKRAAAKVEEYELNRTNQWQQLIKMGMGTKGVEARQALSGDTA